MAPWTTSSSAPSRYEARSTRMSDDQCARADRAAHRPVDHVPQPTTCRSIERDLLGDSVATARCTPDELLTRMSAAFDEDQGRRRRASTRPGRRSGRGCSRRAPRSSSSAGSPSCRPMTAALGERSASDPLERRRRRGRRGRGGVSSGVGSCRGGRAASGARARAGRARRPLRAGQEAHAEVMLKIVARSVARTARRRRARGRARAGRRTGPRRRLGGADLDRCTAHAEHALEPRGARRRREPRADRAPQRAARPARRLPRQGAAARADRGPRASTSCSRAAHRRSTRRRRTSTDADAARPPLRRRALHRTGGTAVTCTEPAAPARSSTATATSAGMAPRRATAGPATTLSRRSSRRAPARRRGYASAPGWSMSRPSAAAIPPTPSWTARRSPSTAASARAATSRSGAAATACPGRTDGFCPHCGAPFSFTPKLDAGELVAGQYEIVGCLAHGGLGWIYLARDRNVVRPLGRPEGPAQQRRRRTRWPRRSPSAASSPRSSTRTSSRSSTSSSTTAPATSSWSTSAATSLRDLLKARRAANGGALDPLPVAQAIAYVLEILPALGHLHERGLLFCDFKPDNVIQTEHGAQADRPRRRLSRRRRDAARSTAPSGYQAPEIAETGRRSPPTCSPSRARSPCCAPTSAATRPRYKYTLPPQDVGRALRALRLALPAARARPPPPIRARPLPVGRRDGRPAARGPARGRRRRAGQADHPRSSRCSPPTPTRAATAPTGGSLPVADHRPGRPGGGVLASSR